MNKLNDIGAFVWPASEFIQITANFGSVIRTPSKNNVQIPLQNLEGVVSRASFGELLVRSPKNIYGLEMCPPRASRLVLTTT